MGLLNYQRLFIQKAIEVNALTFGEFTLKSGRVSPYFFNMGTFQTGADLALLGNCYAKCIVSANLTFDMLFGPAYKGIPLVCSTAFSLASQFQLNYPFAFNRKETKQHGEKGQIVGATPSGKVLLIDDVMTQGTALSQSIDLLNYYKATPAGIVIALDRQEIIDSENTQTALEIMQDKYQIPVYAIITLEDILNFTHISPDQFSDHTAIAIRSYKQKYSKKDLIKNQQ